MNHLSALLIGSSYALEESFSLDIGYSARGPGKCYGDIMLAHQKAETLPTLKNDVIKSYNIGTVRLAKEKGATTASVMLPSFH